MDTVINWKQLTEQIDNDTLIITANNRLSRYLRNKLDQHFAQKNIWNTINCVPFKIFINQLWNQFSHHSANILEESAETLIWQNIIQQAQPDYNLREIQSSATLSQNAWRSIVEWQLPYQQFKNDPRPHIQKFNHWLNQFEKKCQQSSIINFYQAIQVLIQKYKSAILKIPTKIVLAGFEEFSPLQQDFINIIQKNSNIYYFSNQKISQPKTFVANTPEEEITSIANFIKTHLQNNPSHSAGIIFPDLAQKRDQIEKIFKEVLHHDYGIFDYSNSTHFNISLGKALNSFEIVKTLFEILTLNKPLLEFQQFFLLIQSDYIKDSQSEKFDRNILEQQWREKKEDRLTVKELYDYLIENALCGNLQQILKNYTAHISQMPKVQNHDYWQKYFLEMLDIWGWPGERTLDSNEYQIVQRFMELLKQFASLDYLLEPCHFEQAVWRLKELCQNTLFQSESKASAIQVLGLLEAIDMEFDIVWIAGLNENFINAPSPNALLPIEWQKKYHLPHGYLQREYEFAENIFKRLLTNNENIILSYSATENNEEKDPYHLIEPYEKIVLPSIQTPAEKIHSHPVETETISDNYAAAINLEKLSSGKNIIEAMQHCYFKAFAEYRLQAEILSEPFTAGIDYRARGSVIHKVLEKFWNKTQNYQTLINLSKESLKQEIENLIPEVFEEHYNNYRHNITPMMKTIEREVIKTRLLHWLEFEKTRLTFVVLATEKNFNLQLAGKKINIKIDRIDKSPDGKVLIIDYKNSNIQNLSTTDWTNEHIENIQLPLYSLCLSEVDAIALAGINSHYTAFKGIAAENCDSFPELKSVEMDWNQLKASWKQQCEHAIENYITGNATINPTENACSICDLSSLCQIKRLQEQHV